MAKKILVTGSCGFIFSNFVLQTLMKTDYNVVSIDKLTYAGKITNLPLDAINNKRHRLHIGDICDTHFVNKIFEIEKPDYVIHGAAESHVDNSILDPSVFIKTNVMGTNNMLNAALKVYTPEKFINISTDEVFGSKNFGESYETDALDPRSPYSASKASADLLGQAYYATYKLPVITTRCSNIFGPRQDVEKLIPKTINNIIKEKPIPIYGNGSQIRDWLYVNAKFEALNIILERGIIGEVYNIGAEHEIQNIEIVNMICDIMGTGKNLITFVEDRKGHDVRYQVNCNKLKELGWTNKYDFEEALRHTVGWYRANRGWFLK